MTGFVLSPAAQADLSEIWDYTAGRWGEAQAELYVRAIGDVCRELGRGTRRGRPADDVRPGYLRATVGSHILFFRLDETGLVDIVRILHRRMDVNRHL